MVCWSMTAARTPCCRSPVLTPSFCGMIRARWLTCYGQRVGSNNAPERPVPPALPASLRRRGRLATVALAACALLAMTALAAGPYPREQVPRLLVAIVACGPIVLLRRWPLPVLAVTAAASVLLVASSGGPTLVLTLVMSLAIYFAAARLPRKVSIQAA